MRFAVARPVLPRGTAGYAAPWVRWAVRGATFGVVAVCDIVAAPVPRALVASLGRNVRVDVSHTLGGGQRARRLCRVQLLPVLAAVVVVATQGALLLQAARGWAVATVAIWVVAPCRVLA